MIMTPAKVDLPGRRTDENPPVSAERPTRLIRPFSLLLITIVSIVVLVLLFPARRATPGYGDGASAGQAVSARYLQPLQGADPRDRNLRIDLPEQSMVAGETGAGSGTLVPPNNDAAIDVLSLRLDRARQPANGGPPGNGAPEDKLDRMRLLRLSSRMSSRRGAGSQLRLGASDDIDRQDDERFSSLRLSWRAGLRRAE